MAHSDRACAHAPAPGIAPDNQTTHHPADLSALPHTQARAASSWAVEVCDEMAKLKDVLQAYVGLEKLLSPARIGDCNEVAPQRNELGALLRLVNEALALRLEGADATVASLRETLADSGRTG